MHTYIYKNSIGTISIFSPIWRLDIIWNSKYIKQGLSVSIEESISNNSSPTCKTLGQEVGKRGAGAQEGNGEFACFLFFSPEGVEVAVNGVFGTWEQKLKKRKVIQYVLHSVLIYH